MKQWLDRVTGIVTMYKLVIVALAGIGVVLGLAGVAGIVRILVSVLPGLPSTRPLVIATLVAMLVGIVLAACGIPARRAMRVSPTEALRIE